MRPTLIAAIATLGVLAAAAAVYLTSGKAPLPALTATPTPGQPASRLFVVGVLSGVHVVDLKTGKEIKRISTGIIPHNLKLSPDGRHVYVTNVGSQSVSVIDTRTLEKVKDILVGEIPDVAPHKQLAPAKLAQATSCTSCHQNQAIGSLPNALSWTGDGRHLMVSEAAGRAVSWIDPAAGKTVARHRFELPTPSTPANMVVDPRTKEIWVLHRFEAERHGGYGKTKEEAAVASMADFEHDPPAGQKISWVTVHDPEMKREVARLKMDLAVPFDAVFSPDGRRLYVGYRSSNVIAVFDTERKQLLHTWKSGVSPVGLALSPDGKDLYITCLFSVPAVVQIMDAETGEIKVSMGVPPSPSLVRVDPATGYVYVTATGYNRVLEIDTRNQRLLRELPSGHQPLDLLLVP